MKIEKGSICWLIITIMAIIGFVLCIWLWMKPQLKPQAATWVDLNEQIKILTKEDMELKRKGVKISSDNGTGAEQKIKHQRHGNHFASTHLKAESMKGDLTSARINVNEATMDMLKKLPGIGGSKAKAIVTYRDKHGAFRQVDDLKKVKGIGPKLLAAIRDKVCIK